jgi:N-acetylglucosaminyldiphosphoundecaprenol N-acetyl-beta-D-mannosaminyltransferase
VAPPSSVAAGRPLPSHRVLGMRVDAVDPARTLAEVEAWVTASRRAFICFANVHAVMEARRDAEAREAYERSDLTVADGMPLVWLGRRRGFPGAARVYGPDFTLLACERAAAAGWSVFFYGAAPGVADRMASRLQARFPGLRVAGTLSPPFGDLPAGEEATLVRAVNAARPDLVFVGLGCPRQEKWMAAHRDALDAPVLMGVGAAFDFHAGEVRQAPRWMMAAGLEWLYRLSREPRRLWRRYLVLNPLFVLGVVKEALLGAGPGRDGRAR